METIKLKDRTFAVSKSSAEISSKVKSLGQEITRELKDSNPLFVVVLRGAFVFAADLIREFQAPCEVSFIRLKSYEGTTSTGTVKTLMNLEENIDGRTVVIIEDIIDTGTTMKHLLAILEEKHPKEIRIAALLVKPGNLKVDLNINYHCFDIPNDFIVGYGLDFDEQGRNLPAIYTVTD